MSDELFLSIVTDPEAVADPYPRLRQLRETSPVHKLGFSNLWVLTRFEDCRQALRDHRLGIAKAGDETPSLMPGAVYSRDPDRERSMLFLNPRSTPACAPWSARRSPLSGWRACGPRWRS